MVSYENPYPVPGVITPHPDVLNVTTHPSDVYNNQLTVGMIYTISIALLTGTFVITALAFMLIVWKRRRTVVHDHRIARRLMIDSVSSCQTSYQRFDVSDATDVMFSANISVSESARLDGPNTLKI